MFLTVKNYDLEIILCSYLEHSIITIKLLTIRKTKFCKIPESDIPFLSLTVKIKLLCTLTIFVYLLSDKYDVFHSSN